MKPKSSFFWILIILGTEVLNEHTTRGAMVNYYDLVLIKKEISTSAELENLILWFYYGFTCWSVLAKDFRIQGLIWREE